MTKEIVVKQSNQLSLEKTKSLFRVTDKILSRKGDLSVTEETDWMHRLWKWCDENEIQESVIPRNAEKLTQLESLDLCGKNLSKLPSEIGNLTQLKSLDLSDNALAVLPKEIGNLTQLELLFIEFNYLSELPKEIGNLIQLKGLYLVNNEIWILPKEIENLAQLDFFDLRGNHLYEEEGVYWNEKFNGMIGFTWD